MKQYLLALDLGTSSLKASLVDIEGHIVRSHNEGYPVAHPRPGWAEQAPRDWWRALCVCCRALLAGLDAGDVAGLSLTGQMMSCLPLGTGGKVLHSAIIWADSRAEAESKALQAALGAGGCYDITGMHPSANYGLPKMMWLKRHMPEVYGKTAVFLPPKDYLNFRLTGRLATDPENAAYLYCYDAQAGGWSSRLLDAAGIDPARLPAVLSSGTVLGTVHAAAAAECGLATGTPVVMGTGDGSATTLGTGVLSPGEAYVSLGTSSWVCAVAENADTGLESGISRLPYLGGVRLSGTMQAGGYSYSWLRDTLCGPEREEAEKTGQQDFQLIDALAAKAPPGAGGVLFSPYLLGERAPFWDARLRASFVGITAQTGRAQLCRSVLEGVGLHLGLILQRICACLPAGAITDVKLVGGGAASPLWRQIFADVFGMPVHTVENPRQSAALGLAVMTGTALGLFPDVSVIRAFQPVACTTTPDPARVAYYQELSGIFADTAHALRDINHRLAGLRAPMFDGGAEGRTF